MSDIDYEAVAKALNEAKVPTSDRVVMLPDGTTVKVTL